MTTEEIIRFIKTEPLIETFAIILTIILMFIALIILVWSMK